jgi:hypothetical protein
VAVDAAPAATARFRGCAASVRADTYRGTVAPAALLYLADPAAAPQVSWVERAGGARIVVALVTVLAVALAASVILAARIVRPLRQLTRASRQLATGSREAASTCGATTSSRSSAPRSTTWPAPSPQPTSSGGDSCPTSPTSCATR